MKIITILSLSTIFSHGIKKDSFPVEINSKVFYSTKSEKFKSFNDRVLILKNSDEGYLFINQITQSINVKYKEMNEDDSTFVEVNEIINVDTNNPIADTDSEKRLLENLHEFTKRNIFFKVDYNLKKLQEVKKRKIKENIFEYWKEKIPKLHEISHFSGIFYPISETSYIDTLLSDDKNGLYITTYTLKSVKSNGSKEYSISGRYYPLNTQKIEDKNQEDGTLYSILLDQLYNGSMICDGTYITFLKIDTESKLINYSSFLDINEEVEKSGILKIENSYKLR